MYCSEHQGQLENAFLYSSFEDYVLSAYTPTPTHPDTHTKTHARTLTRTHARSLSLSHTHTHTHARTHSRTHARTHAHNQHLENAFLYSSSEVVFSSKITTLVSSWTLENVLSTSSVFQRKKNIFWGNVVSGRPFAKKQ